MIHYQSSEERTPLELTDLKQPVDDFFRKEGELLRRHLSPLAEEPHLHPVVTMLVEQLSDAMHRPEKLVTMIQDRFLERMEAIYTATDILPELRDLLSDKIAENIEANEKEFGERYLLLLKVIINSHLQSTHTTQFDELVDTPRTPRHDYSAAGALNRSFSHRPDKDPNEIYRYIYRPEKAHLIFWDLDITLDILTKERSDTLKMESLKSDLSSTKAASSDPAERAQLANKVTALNTILETLPNQPVTDSSYQQLVTLVRGYIDRRITEIFPAGQASRTA